MSGCNCFVAKHPDAAAIESALRAGMDPREVATRFGVGKSRVYDHRRHLGLTASEPSGDPSGEATAAVPEPRPDASGVAPRKKPSSPPMERRGMAKTRVPPDSSTDSTEKGGHSMERGGSFHGTPSHFTEVASRAQPQVVDIAGGTAGKLVHGTGYLFAVQDCTAAIVDATSRADLIPKIAARYGLSRGRARQAFSEAARHLRLDMGGYAERLEVSIAWVVKQRDEAKTKAEMRELQAADWRAKEAEANDLAEGMEGESRIAALDSACRFGSVAAKYGLEAEKWAAQALAHQRHLDDIQGLKMPKELHATQINFGGADLEQFGALLAERFRGRPDVLAEIDAAVSAAEQQGDAAAIDTTGEAV